MRYGLCALALLATTLSATAQDRVIDAHSYGYVPVTVPATVRVVANRTNFWRSQRVFDVYITPNIVPEAEALSRAAFHAAAFCNRTFGSDRVKLYDRARHSALDLESWAFRGRCKR